MRILGEIARRFRIFEGKRRTFVLLTALAILYVLLFVPPNRTGCADENMLAVFKVDEWTQYPYLIRMTTRAQTLEATLIRVVDYKHYFYGYPFYLSSAVAIFPQRAWFKLRGEAPHTQALMLVLREMSPLLMAGALLLLVWLWTDFSSPAWGALLFLFLGSIPGLFENNMWWHPDSLAALYTWGGRIFPYAISIFLYVVPVLLLIITRIRRLGVR
jgi:hypothetical protein